jgi:hypothetical protein
MAVVARSHTLIGMLDGDASLVLIPAVTIALQALCLLLAMRAERRHRLVDDLPLSKTSGVFIGLVDVHRQAESAQPLTSPLSGTSCVRYRRSVAESWSREETETSTDDKGRQQTRTVTKSGWTTVASGGEEQAVALRDDHGTIRIQPAGADIEPVNPLEATCDRQDRPYFAEGPAQEIRDSAHRRRFSENGIPLGAMPSVIGQARERRDAVAPEIARDPQAPLFLISTRSERAAASSFRLHALLRVLGGLLPIAVLACQDQRALWSAPPAIACVAGLCLGACLLAWLAMAYNSLVELRQRVRQGWANVDVQLKRRADLIPGLVAVVEAMQHHEQDTLTHLALLRSQAMTIPPGVAGPDAKACAPVLVALSERYPALSAERTFTDLARTLTDCEERNAPARATFSDIATYLDTHREAFPDRLIAGLAGITAQELKHADGFERAAPVVRLAATARAALAGAAGSASAR